jgi:glycolate oxidase FAD binding subunit
MKIQAAGLNGIVSCRAIPGLNLEDASAMLSSLTNLAAECGGNVIVCRCPPDWKRSLPVWGRPTADRELMRTVKRTLDPDDVFNPGRLFGNL